MTQVHECFGGIVLSLIAVKANLCFALFQRLANLIERALKGTLLWVDSEGNMVV